MQVADAGANLMPTTLKNATKKYLQARNLDAVTFKSNRRNRQPDSRVGGALLSCQLLRAEVHNEGVSCVTSKVHRPQTPRSIWT
jgi:hypothetical protein